MSDSAPAGLLNFTEESYGDRFKPDILEQYKLYVQSADNVSNRRVASNRYLVPLNAALVAIYGFQSTGTAFAPYWIILVGLVGVIVSGLSWNIIKSHRDLNNVKFQVISELEHLLPASIYDYEWRIANEGKGERYRSVSWVELWLHFMFLGLHIVAIALVSVTSFVP